MSQVVSILLIVIAAAGLRILSGIDNGCFYAKGQRRPPELIKYLDNIHFSETPFWYLLFGMVTLAVWWILPGTHWLRFLEAPVIALGASGLANYHYQKYINIGSGLPAVDPNENPKSEFAWGPVSFWWPRPWYGTRRRFIPVIAAITIVSALVLNAVFP